MAANGSESAARHTALAVTSRRRLLEVLRAAEGPLGAEELAAAVELHVTTARHHLETLGRAGLVQRSTAPAGRPGRPRLLYTASAGVAADGYRQLAELLSSALADDPDGGRRRAEQAGERWADEQIPAGDQAGDQVIGELRTIFERLGFAPRHTASGTEHRLLLDACPFRDIARAHPEVVCSVHLGLMRAALRRMGAADARSELHPFVHPELCVADVALPG